MSQIQIFLLQKTVVKTKLCFYIKAMTYVVTGWWGLHSRLHLCINKYSHGFVKRHFCKSCRFQRKCSTNTNVRIDAREHDKVTVMQRSAASLWVIGNNPKTHTRQNKGSRTKGFSIVVKTQHIKKKKKNTLFFLKEPTSIFLMRKPTLAPCSVQPQPKQNNGFLRLRASPIRVAGKMAWKWSLTRYFLPYQ